MNKLKTIIRILIIIILFISCDAADQYLGINENLLEEEEDGGGSGGGGGGFSPASISNLELWLDASDTSTITTTGTDVDQWRDKSGNGRHFVQTLVPGYRPNINATGLNNKNTIRFTQATFEKLQLASGKLECIVSTIFIVYKPFNAAEIQYFFLADSDTTTNYRFWSTALSTFNLRVSGTTSEAITINNLSNANPHILLVKLRDNGSKVLFSLDGDVELPSVNDLTNTSYTFNTLCATTNADVTLTNLFYGDIADVIIYNVILSDTNKQKIEGYLAWKWGLTGSLPAGHPYKLSPP